MSTQWISDMLLVGANIVHRLTLAKNNDPKVEKRAYLAAGSKLEFTFKNYSIKIISLEQ